MDNNTEVRLSRLEAWTFMLIEQASPRIQKKAALIAKGMRPCTDPHCMNAWRPGILTNGSLVPTPCDRHAQDNDGTE